MPACAASNRQRLLGLVAALTGVFVLGFGAGRSFISPRGAFVLRFQQSGASPLPKPLAALLQPSGGQAALPFSYPKPQGQHAERLPPEKLGRWLKYAGERQCSTDDADYEQIFQQLTPWRAQGGIPAAAVAAAHARLDSTSLFEIQQGKLAPNISSWGGNRQSIEYWTGLLQELAPGLPDLKLLFTSYDKPRSWVGQLPAAAEAALASGQLSEGAAWLRYGCDAESEGWAALRSRHAAFAPTGVRAVRGLLPVFSGATIPGCFGDLLVPRWWGSTAPALERPSKTSGCPMSNATWDSKKDIAFWRGTSTGSFVDASIPAQLWTSYHRQRLVALSKLHPTALDAAFTAIAGCAKPQCEAMRQVYGTAPGVATPEYFSHRYLVIVDGNSVANRLAPSLCSGSLVLLSQLFCEWFAFRLVPNTHFVPVRLDYADLVPAVHELRRDHSRAQGIVAAATDLVNTRLREEDAKCYMYRLLLEYAAIYNR